MGGREVEDDHDLLTYNEAGARLREEIRLVREALSGMSGGGSEERRALQLRLDLLLDSEQRNTALAVQDTDARGFLEYRPAARSTNH